MNIQGNFINKNLNKSIKNLNLKLLKESIIPLASIPPNVYLNQFQRNISIATTPTENINANTHSSSSRSAFKLNKNLKFKNGILNNRSLWLSSFEFTPFTSFSYSSSPLLFSSSLLLSLSSNYSNTITPLKKEKGNKKVIDRQLLLLPQQNQIQNEIIFNRNNEIQRKNLKCYYSSSSINNYNNNNNDNNNNEKNNNNINNYNNNNNINNNFNNNFSNSDNNNNSNKENYKNIKNQNENEKKNENKNENKNEYENENENEDENENEYENEDDRKEEEEDELNKVLYSSDNFFVREFKEIKSILWHLIFGSQVLYQEMQQADKINKKKKIQKKNLSRREELLVRRSFHDVVLAIPFLIMISWATCTTLLFASVIPNLIPTVYVTPYQKRKILLRNQKIRRKVARKARKMAPWVPFDVRRFYSRKSILMLCRENQNTPFDLDRLSWWHLKSIAGYLGLFSYLPKSILKVRLYEYMEYLEEDDMLIRNEGVYSLNLEELRMANEQRGYSTLGLTKKELRENLNQWLDFHYNSENIRVPRLLTILSKIYSENQIIDESYYIRKQQIINKRRLKKEIRRLKRNSQQMIKDKKRLKKRQIKRLVKKNIYL